MGNWIKIGVPIIIASLIISITVVSSVSAQGKYSIPVWVKGVANFWVEGNISDDEFGEALTFLIEQGILKVEMPASDNDQTILTKKISQLEAENTELKADLAELNSEKKILEEKLSGLKPEQETSESDFSSLSCTQDLGYVTMTGKFTNGPNPISFLVVMLAVEDSKGNIVATGSGNIQDLAPHQTKFFDAMARYTGPFTNCYVEIDYYYD